MSRRCGCKPSNILASASTAFRQLLLGLVICVGPWLVTDALDLVSRRCCCNPSASTAFRQLLLGLVICVAQLFNQFNRLTSGSPAYAFRPLLLGLVICVPSGLVTDALEFVSWRCGCYPEDILHCRILSPDSMSSLQSINGFNLDSHLVQKFLKDYTVLAKKWQKHYSLLDSKSCGNSR